MEIFGVGPLELLLVLVLALVILGPEDMVGTSRRIGQWIYRVVRSPTWRAILSTTQDLRELPQKIVRDAGIEEAMKEVKDTVNDAKNQVSEATREVNSEMLAATREVNSEMQVATQQVSQGMQLPGESTTGMPNSTPYSTPDDGSNNQIWPEQALAGYNPPTPSTSSSISPSGVYATPTPRNPSYGMQLDEFARALATSPRSAADLEGIMRPPEPPPPTLAAPGLIAGALSFMAFGAAPADLEVPFVFADPTDYPDAQPAAEAPAELPDDAAAQETAPEESAPGVEAAEAAEPALPDEDTINAGLEEAMAKRMRDMDEVFKRLDAQARPEAYPPSETESEA